MQGPIERPRQKLLPARSESGCRWELAQETRERQGEDIARLRTGTWGRAGDRLSHGSNDCSGSRGHGVGDHAVPSSHTRDGERI